MRDYWGRVMAAEAHVFGRQSDIACRCVPLRMGDLAMLDAGDMAVPLRSDIHVVFGASYIRGDLCAALVARRAINLHMGVSPEYRGSGCNFWAEYDRKPEYVGATVHTLTAGLDSGPIIRRAIAPPNQDPFARGMLAVQAGIDAACGVVRSRDFAATPQDSSRLIRCSRYNEFTDAVVADYLGRVARLVEALR
jgi:formyltetrahydrofolate hydrolase